MYSKSTAAVVLGLVTWLHSLCSCAARVSTGAVKGYEDQKLVNMSGPDRAGHSTVLAGFQWLLLHDIHMAA